MIVNEYNSSLMELQSSLILTYFHLAVMLAVLQSSLIELDSSVIQLERCKCISALSYCSHMESSAIQLLVVRFLIHLRITLIRELYNSIRQLSNSISELSYSLTELFNSIGDLSNSITELSKCMWCIREPSYSIKVLSNSIKKISNYLSLCQFCVP